MLHLVFVPPFFSFLFPLSTVFRRIWRSIFKSIPAESARDRCAMCMAKIDILTERASL